MELKLNIEFEQLVRLIRQLPAQQIVKLRAELTDDLVFTAPMKEITDFQKLLLNGPTMEAGQEKIFEETGKRFKEWRKK